MALLNDMFGIQARGGCACAGPFGQALLGIDYQLAKDIEDALLDDEESEVLRPGFTRIGFPYFMSDAKAQYIIDAVDWIASVGTPCILLSLSLSLSLSLALLSIRAHCYSQCMAC